MLLRMALRLFTFTSNLTIHTCSLYSSLNIIYFRQTHVQIVTCMTHLFHLLVAMSFLSYGVCACGSLDLTQVPPFSELHQCPLFVSLIKHNFYKPSYLVVDVSWMTVLTFQEYIFPDDSYGFSFTFSQLYAFHSISK